MVTILVSVLEKSYLIELGGVVQYDFGKTTGAGVCIRRGTLNKPGRVLMTEVMKLQARHRTDGSQIPLIISEMLRNKPRMREIFDHPGFDYDLLFYPNYAHVDKSDGDCKKCDASMRVFRKARPNTEPLIHYGLIASGDQVMCSSVTRDNLRKDLGIVCFEMEAAGLMDDFPCLVIRGICDYSDSHKTKFWQPYAAVTSAAYAKELLKAIPPSEVESTKLAVDSVRQG